ncbi:hypothetical protein AB0G02_08505, partial [Actinosynnema sp. NPDC023658]|uniref:hypothetical protein n=1 Tax=Actinosynnema sp. NPDC023658 TaxID=3155465 RepID=UPI0033C768C8
GEAEVLWRPDPDRVRESRMTAFRSWLASSKGTRTHVKSGLGGPLRIRSSGVIGVGLGGVVGFV